MAIARGPKIVTNGLVLSLDAADKMSYKGSGTVWKDLSGSNINGTLTNSPTFSVANCGNIAFNGSTQYVNFNSTYTSLDLIDKSFCAWIYLESTFASTGGIIDKDFDNGGVNYGGWGWWIQTNRKLWWWNHANLDLLDDGVNTLALGNWSFASVTYDSTSKSASFYINGVLNSTKTNASIVEKSSTGANLIFASIRNATQAFLNGRLANVLAYNRSLTASEILQNYNANKERFGL